MRAQKQYRKTFKGPILYGPYHLEFEFLDVLRSQKFILSPQMRQCYLLLLYKAMKFQSKIFKT